MNKAAFFDLDGTLVSGVSSERMFLKHLLQRKMLNYGDLFKMLLGAINNLNGGWDKAFRQNKYYLKGRSVGTIEQLAQEFFAERVNTLISQRAKEKIREQKLKGDLLILISGTPHFIIEIFCRKLAFDDWKGAQIDSNNEKFTGKIKGLHPFGRRKVEVLKTFTKKYSIDLTQSTAYGNHFSDRFLLAEVRNPVVVNPDRALLKYALKKNWEILSF